MTIKEDNRIIISIDELKDYLMAMSPLGGGSHLMTDKCQVSVFYNTTTNEYLLIDPNDLTKTQSFTNDKIDALITKIKAALQYAEAISIHNLTTPTSLNASRVKIRI